MKVLTAFLLAALLLVMATHVAAEPRAITDAEAAAVVVAAAFLEGGPSAIYAQLDPQAPLRALPKAEALAQLHQSTGRHEGATWTLRTTDASSDAAFAIARPDGSADGLLFRMKRTGNAWRLHEVLTLADSTAEPLRAPAGRRPPLPVKPLAVAAALTLIGLGILAQHRLLGVALLAAGTAFGAATLYPHLRPPPDAARRMAARAPLEELSRARIALDAGNEGEAALAFDRAAAMKPVRDDILHEAANSLTGDRSRTFLQRMRGLGSRDADAYYREGTYEAFRTAWMLDPKPREDLVRENLLTDLRAKALVSFYSALEPIRRSPILGTRAAAWPAGASTFICGERLRVEIGAGALEIPNGAALAPRNALVVPATYGEDRRHAGELRAAQDLLKKSGTARHTRLITAVFALARNRRWPDVLTLTSGELTPDLVVLRMRALLRMNRFDEARALAETDAVRKLRDPNAVLAIAEGLSMAGQWSTADRLFRAVQSKPHEELIRIQLRRLELRRALATSSQVLATANFDVRHDAKINPALASRIGELLEAELARLRQKFPPVDFRRVPVNVLSWEEFSSDITGGDHILGLYDGEILFPFAAVAQFKPEVVAVITHELTHAIIAQATRDNAPRWFQEGVATRMELVERQENAFTETPPALVLPVSLLDAVMETNSEPAAYVVAQTFIRFLEDRYGAVVIARLTGELARGSSTDDALTKLTGKSLDAINTDFRQWGFNHNGNFARTEPWPYSHLYSLGVDPRVRAGFNFPR